MGVYASGVQSVVDYLRGLGERAANPTLFRDRAYEILLGEERERWSESPWLPLKGSTEKRKAREQKDPRTLRVTGLLERALTDPDAPGQKWEQEGDEMVFGLEQAGPAFYGIFHQLGDGVPRREVVKATPRLRRQMRRAWARWIVGKE